MSGEAAVHPAANSVPRAPGVRSQQSFDGMLHAVRTQEQEEAAENAQFMQLEAELRLRKQEAKRLNEEAGELLKVREKALAHAQRERAPLPPGLSASGARGLLARKLSIVESSMKLLRTVGDALDKVEHDLELIQPRVVQLESELQLRAVKLQTVREGM